MVKVPKNKHKKTHRNIKKNTKKSTRRFTRSSNLKNTKRKTKGNKSRSIRKNNLRKNYKKVKRKNKYGMRGGSPFDDWDARITLQQMNEKLHRIDIGQPYSYFTTEALAQRKRQKQKEEDEKGGDGRFDPRTAFIPPGYVCTEQANVLHSPKGLREQLKKENPEYQKATVQIREGGTEALSGWKKKWSIIDAATPQWEEKCRKEEAMASQASQATQEGDAATRDLLEQYEAREERHEAEQAQQQIGYDNRVDEEGQEIGPEELTPFVNQSTPPASPKPRAPPVDQEIGSTRRLSRKWNKFMNSRKWPWNRRKNNKGGGGRRKRPQKTKRRTKRTN